MNITCSVPNGSTMNSWVGLKTRKVGEAQKDQPLEGRGTAAGDILNASVAEQHLPSSPTQKAPNSPSGGIHVQLQSSGSELTLEGYANKGGARPQVSHWSAEGGTEYGRLLQNWTSSSQLASHQHPMPPHFLLPPQGVGSRPISPATASLLAELWQPRKGAGGDNPRLFPGLPAFGGGSSAFTVVPESHSPKVATSAPLRRLTSALHNADLTPISGASDASDPQIQRPERQLSNGGGSIMDGNARATASRIAQVIDARTPGLMSPLPSLEPSFYDFLQMGQPLGTRHSPQHSSPQSIAFGAQNLPPPQTSELALGQSGIDGSLQRERSGSGRFSFSPLILPTVPNESPGHSPREPDTPSIPGFPNFSKSPEVNQGGPASLLERKASPMETSAGGEPRDGARGREHSWQQQKGTAGEEARESRRGDSWQLLEGKAGEEPRRGHRDSCLGFHLEGIRSPPGTSEMAGTGFWSAGEARQPPSSPALALTDFVPKRARKAPDAAKRPGKRPKLTIEITEQGDDDLDNEKDNLSDDPLGDKLDKSPTSENPDEHDTNLRRQLSDARAQLSDAQGQLLDARGQLSDVRGQLAQAEASSAADRTRWQQREAAWQSFRAARVLTSALGGTRSPDARGAEAGGEGTYLEDRGGANGRYSNDDVTKMFGGVGERLSRTETMLIAALAEIARLRAWMKQWKEGVPGVGGI